MRVLQVHNRYREAGGEDAVVAAEAALLRAAGHEVTQHLVDNPPGSLAAAGSLALAPWNPAARQRVTRLAKRFRPDVAHVHNTWFALSPAVLRGLHDAGFPVVVTLHNYRLLCANAQLFRDGAACEECVGSHPWKGLRHRCYRESAAASAVAAGTIALHRSAGTWREVDLFLALTDFARSLFVRGGLPAERVIVKPNSAPDPGPRAAPPSRSDTVVYVGRLAEEKGVLDLLRLWQEEAPPGLQLVLAGDGPLAGPAATMAVPGVRFVGRLAPDEVRRLMLGARALVFPSRLYEGQPMALLEALAAGLPVVAPAGGGAGSTLPRPVPGWLVEPGSPDGWRRALAALADDEAVDERGRQARAAYGAFTPERSLRGLEAAYRRVVGSAAGPSRPG